MRAVYGRWRAPKHALRTPRPPAFARSACSRSAWAKQWTFARSDPGAIWKALRGRTRGRRAGSGATAKRPAGKRQADRGCTARLADCTAPEGTAGIGDSEGNRLQLGAMARAHALHRRRHIARRQQLGREPDPADRHRTIELAIRRKLARWETCRRDHEPDPLGPHDRARSARLPAGRARAAANAAGQSHRRTPAASLDVDRSEELSVVPVKTGSPDAYRGWTLLDHKGVPEHSSAPDLVLRSEVRQSLSIADRVRPLHGGGPRRREPCRRLPGQASTHIDAA